MFDANMKGFITAEDVKNVLVNLNPKIIDEEIEQIIREADTNEDGVLDYE